MKTSRIAAALAAALAVRPAACRARVRRGPGPVGQGLSGGARRAGRCRAPPRADPDLRGMWPVDYLCGHPARAAARDRDANRVDRGGISASGSARPSSATGPRGGTGPARHPRHGPLARGRPAAVQTSMITQPANGRHPALTEEGRRAAAAAVKNSWNTEVFDKITDFGIWDRCLSRGMPGSMLTGAYNMGLRATQAPEPGGDRDRDGPRYPQGLPRRPRGPAARGYRVPRLFPRALGRRHAGDRDDQLHPRLQQRPLAQQRADEGHRTDHPGRPRPVPRRSLDRGSGHADRAVQDRHSVAAQPELRVLRIRLPRRQRAGPRLHHRHQPPVPGSCARSNGPSRANSPRPWQGPAGAPWTDLRREMDLSRQPAGVRRLVAVLRPDAFPVARAAAARLRAGRDRLHRGR